MSALEFELSLSSSHIFKASSEHTFFQSLFFSFPLILSLICRAESAALVHLLGISYLFIRVRNPEITIRLIALAVFSSVYDVLSVDPKCEPKRHPVPLHLIWFKVCILFAVMIDAFINPFLFRHSFYTCACDSFYDLRPFFSVLYRCLLAGLLTHSHVALPVSLIASHILMLYG